MKFLHFSNALEKNKTYMPFPKFTIFKDAAGEFRFNLFAVNGRQILRCSEGYVSKQGCKNGIESTQKNASEDARYKRTTSKSEKYYFTHHARNGECIGISQMYTSAAGRDNGIEAIMRDAPIAEVEDLTVAKKDETPTPPKKQKGDYLPLVMKDPKVFVGRPIKEFVGDSFDSEAAVKVRTSTWSPEEQITDKLERLFTLPGSEEIDALTIGAWEDPYDKAADIIIEKLIELKDKLQGIKHLFVGDMTYEESEISWIIQGDYSNLWKHFPNLETFGVRGSVFLKLGKIDHPNLKNIVIETGGLDGSVIDDLNASDLPNLEYLEIWLGTDEYGCTVEVDQLQPILNCKFPKLKFMGLMDYYLADDMAEALEGAPTFEGLNILDVSMGIMTDRGAQALYKNEALLTLDHINARFHYFTDEWMNKLAEKFAQQNINLDDQMEPYDDYYYVEVGE